MLFKGDTRAFAFRRYIAGRLLGVSFMTLGNWSAGRSSAYGDHCARPSWNATWRTTPCCPSIGNYAADGPKFLSTQRKQGIPIQAADAWIAAGALYCQVPLITNNANDYSTVRGLTVLTA